MVCAPFTAATRFFAGCSLICHDAVQSESGDRLSRRTRWGRTVAEGKLISRIGAFGLLGRPCRVASCHRAERERPAGGEAGGDLAGKSTAYVAVLPARRASARSSPSTARF